MLWTLKGLPAISFAFHLHPNNFTQSNAITQGRIRHLCCWASKRSFAYRNPYRLYGTMWSAVHWGTVHGENQSVMWSVIYLVETVERMTLGLCFSPGFLLELDHLVEEAWIHLTAALNVTAVMNFLASGILPTAPGDVSSITQTAFHVLTK